MGSRVLSIEIGIQSTRVCEISKGSGGKRILKSICFSTPDNTVEDGYIIDKGTFAEVLKSKLKEAGFCSNKAIFTIASTKIYTKEIILPQVSPSKIKEIIETNINDYLPFSVADYVLNYSVLQKMRENKVKKMRVLLVAMPDNLIKNYYSVAQLADLEVESIDYVGNSVYQMLKQVPEKDTVVYIQMNEQSTMVSILKERLLVLQRTISYGTDEIVRAVMERNPSLNMDEIAIYELLSEENFITRDVVAYQDAVEEAAVSTAETSKEGNSSINVYDTVEAVSETATYLISSLGRVMDYYINQTGNSIEKIYLVGYGTRIKGMHEFIQRELGIYPRELLQFHGVHVGKQAVEFKKNPSEFVNSIGAIIAPMKFQPKELAEKKEKRNNVIDTVVIVSLCLVASVSLYILAKQNYREAKTSLEETQAILDSISTDELTQSDIEKVMEELQQITALHANTIKNTEHLSVLIEAFEKNMVKLTSLSAIQVTNESVEMNVSFPSNEAAAKMIQQLENLKVFFREIVVTSVTEDYNRPEVTVNYHISCRFNIIGKEVTEQ